MIEILTIGFVMLGLVLLGAFMMFKVLLIIPEDALDSTVSIEKRIQEFKDKVNNPDK